jgi:hypothetical protein
MTYRKKATMAAIPANARLPLTVEAAPVNLGGALVVGEVVFLAGTGAAETDETVVGLGTTLMMLETVVGQALMVTVTTAGVVAGGGGGGGV